MIHIELRTSGYCSKRLSVQQENNKFIVSRRCGELAVGAVYEDGPYWRPRYCREHLLKEVAALVAKAEEEVKADVAVEQG